MLSRFFGKGDKSPESPRKEAKDTRGLEVVEDDPDTAWSMWDSALAEQDSKQLQAPAGPAKTDEHNSVIVNDKPIVTKPGELDVSTQPMSLEELSLEQRKERALQVVELYHRRIANTIRTLWGYKECGIYINKLIMSGGDGMGQARVGFNQEAVEAMLALSNIHDAQFGAPDDGGGLGFSL
jgi:hypothetical protein